MQTKDYTVQVKAVGTEGGLAEGQFEAIVAAWNRDSYGDKITPGAFADDIAAWKASPDQFPIVWAHRWEDPFSHVGHAIEIEERNEGLWVRAQIDDIDTNPTAAQVYKLLSQRRIRQFSFAFDVLEGSLVEQVVDGDADSYFEIRKVRIYEAGPCLIGVNQETELLDVKAARLAAQIKAGRVLSQSNYDSLTSARDSLDQVISSATPAEEPDEIQEAPDPDGSVVAPESNDEAPTGKSEANGGGTPRMAAARARVLTATT